MRRWQAMSSTESFEQAIEASHRALDGIARGNLEGFADLYSRREDATVANPYGPPARGWKEIEEAGARAAANYRDGRAIEFVNFATYVSGDLGYTVEIERFETKVAGSDELTPVALRVTSIFRREGDTWKLLHRHADPITTLQPGESVVRT
jgi:ketosteroid isomerase-like protein